MPLVNKYHVISRINGHTCVRAEHSTYFTALSSRASFSPLSGYRGRCLFFASFSIVLLSSRRSICVPTNRKGVREQWWEISGTHWGERIIKWLYSDFLSSCLGLGIWLLFWYRTKCACGCNTKTVRFFVLFTYSLIWQKSKRTDETDKSDIKKIFFFLFLKGQDFLLFVCQKNW